MATISLSADAKKLLRHFRDKRLPQLAYEYPSTLAALFSGSAETCEAAQQELASVGLLVLGPEVPRHIPQADRIQSAALTLECERYFQKNSLD